MTDICRARFGEAGSDGLVAEVKAIEKQIHSSQFCLVRGGGSDSGFGGGGKRWRTQGHNIFIIAFVKCFLPLFSLISGCESFARGKCRGEGDIQPAAFYLHLQFFDQLFLSCPHLGVPWRLCECLRFQTFHIFLYFSTKKNSISNWQNCTTPLSWDQFWTERQSVGIHPKSVWISWDPSQLRTIPNPGHPTLGICLTYQLFCTEKKNSVSYQIEH